jgi:hypothetical protein
LFCFFVLVVSPHNSQIAYIVAEPVVLCPLSLPLGLP